MDRIGRPFGTERSPTDSLSRHLKRQAESRTPVERLERNAGPGGRRRARQEEQSSGRRSRVGPRPEERRADRQARGEPSRRATEARNRQTQHRERNPGSRAAETAAGFRSERSGAAATQESPAPDFRSRLSQQGRSEPGGSAARVRGTESPGSPDPLAAPVAPATIGQLPAASRGFAPAPGAPLAAPGATGPGAAANPGPALAGTTGPSETAVPDKPNHTAEETPARWSETPEAERAAQVLRQFRLQLNPGMRSATLHLSPAELGRISIRLTVKEGRVSALVRAETEETLNVLQRHLPELEASFAQQGLELGELDIGLGFGADGGRGADGSSADAGAGLPEELDAPIETEIDRTALARALARDAGVDFYA